MVERAAHIMEDKKRVKREALGSQQTFVSQSPDGQLLQTRPRLQMGGHFKSMS